MNGTTKFIAHIVDMLRSTRAASTHSSPVDQAQHHAGDQRDRQREPQLPAAQAVPNDGLRGGAIRVSVASRRWRDGLRHQRERGLVRLGRG